MSGKEQNSQKKSSDSKIQKPKPAAPKPAGAEVAPPPPQLLRQAIVKPTPDNVRAVHRAYGSNVTRQAMRQARRELQRKSEPADTSTVEQEIARAFANHPLAGAAGLSNTLSRAADDGIGGRNVGGPVEQQIESKRGGGSPLPENTRQQMEGTLQADLSKVRVHTDHQ